jgi:hypothetical protein
MTACGAAKCRWQKFKSFRNELCYPAAVGGMFILCLFDLIIVPVPAISFILSHLIARIRFGEYSFALCGA